MCPSTKLFGIGRRQGLRRSRGAITGRWLTIEMAGSCNVMTAFSVSTVSVIGRGGSPTAVSPSDDLLTSDGR